MSEASSIKLPKAFIWRRVHSLLGLWLVIFLMEHLLTNSQAALFLGDNAQGFVRFVNLLHDLPYMPVVEISLLGIPIVLHAAYGIKYALSARANSGSSDGAKPSLKYGRNRAYTWQRITSWILLFMLIFHVAKFRFIEYPVSVEDGKRAYHMVRVEMDSGLYSVADRLGAEIFDAEAIEESAKYHEKRVKRDERLIEQYKQMKNGEPLTITGPQGEPFDKSREWITEAVSAIEFETLRIHALQKRSLDKDQVIVQSSSFGTATLFTVRNTFKNPLYVGLYTLFVLAACFHAFNGLWTFMISWGAVIRVASQRHALRLALALMALIAALGLASVWGTYWLNLRT